MRLIGTGSGLHEAEEIEMEDLSGELEMQGGEHDTHSAVIEARLAE